jgi:hypothetical protein
LNPAGNVTFQSPMAKQVLSASSKRKKDDESHQRELLTRLKKIAESLGTEVREERLFRDLGYKARSGVCRVDGREVLLLDRNVSVTERVDTLLDFLAGCELDTSVIDPDLRDLIVVRVSRRVAGASEVQGSDH